MADGSDSPADLVRYHRLLEEGYDCAFGSRFVKGSVVRDYPKLKLAMNRAANLVIRGLFRHGYNDTTNAFKAYRREVIETAQPLLSNHFNLTVELPLKAIVRGHTYGIVPISWTNRAAGAVEARPEGDGEPLRVHRPLRLARAPPDPGRLPPEGARAGFGRSRPAEAGAPRGPSRSPSDSLADAGLMAREDAALALGRGARLDARRLSARGGRARASPRAPGARSGPTPTVTVVVAAHDEETVIERRLENLLALDYPPERLDVVVASDASEDGTDAIVERVAAREPRVRLLRCPRGGKVAAQNLAVPRDRR